MKEPGRRPDRASDAAVFFDGGRLTLARQLAGLRKSELASRLSKSPTAVAAWESGVKRPSAATVAQLSLCFGLEPGFFSVRSDRALGAVATPHYRSLRSTTQAARDQASAYAYVSICIAQTLERYVEFPEPVMVEYPVSCDSNDDGPELAARMIREKWKIGTGPIKHLVRLLENHGIIVIFSPPQSASVDAYSVGSHPRPVVVLNPVKRDYYRQRFDVAHELGHLVMHADAEPGDRIAEEQANRFASELLMPADDVGNMLPTVMGPSAWLRLRRLKEEWGVSLQALLFRARRLGRLNDVSYRNAMSTVSARGWRLSEPGLINVIEQPSLLPKAVALLAEAGIDERTLVEQSQVPVELFRTVTSRTPRAETFGVQPESNESNASGVISLLEWRAGSSSQSSATA